MPTDEVLGAYTLNGTEVRYEYSPPVASLEGYTLGARGAHAGGQASIW